jgi:hypothetical protein
MEHEIRDQIKRLADINEEIGFQLVNKLGAIAKELHQIHLSLITIESAILDRNSDEICPACER